LVSTIQLLMFPLSIETIESHRNMKKLPKVQKFLSSISRGTIFNNRGYKTSVAYLYQFLDTKYSSLNLETIIDSIKSKTIDVYEFLDEFMAFLYSKKLCQASRKQYLIGVKSYLQYHDIDIVPRKFKMRVKLPIIPQEDELAIDQNDIRKILLQCHTRRLKTYILVLASSGIRAIEACAIRFCDVYFDESPTRIHIRAEYTKTKRSRDVYISDEASHYLREWVERRLGITLDKTTKISKLTSESLLFQVSNNRKVEPKTIYNKLVRQFETLLDETGCGQRKDGMQRRQITFHSFRRFVKTTISDAVGSDYSESILGHKKSTYYVRKAEAQANIYSTKCMKYLTFLDYSTLQATGRSTEAKIKELEKENQIISQKYDQDMKSVREQMNQIIMMVQQNPRLANIKPEILVNKIRQ
jgi:integrase